MLKDKLWKKRISIEAEIAIFKENQICYNSRLRVKLRKESCIRVNIRELDKVPSIVYLFYIH